MDVVGPKIEVVLAGPEQRLILEELLGLYAEDFREFHSVPVGPDGRIVYEKLPLYWSEAGRHPFLVMVDGAVSGFVFVKRGSEVSADPDVWDMAEFFVVRGARRRGVGSEVARQVWRMFPGWWEVRVMEANQSAVVFWSRAVGRSIYTAVSTHCVEVGKIGWLVFAFQAG